MYMKYHHYLNHHSNNHTPESKASNQYEMTTKATRGGQPLREKEEGSFANRN